MNELKEEAEHWILQIEKLVAVVVILITLQLSGVFLAAYTFETLMQFLLFSCAVGWLFSKRIAYIGLVFLIWRYIAELTIALFYFMRPATIGMAIFAIILMILGAVTLLLLYVTDKRLREKYACSKKLSRIVLLGGIAAGIIIFVLDWPL